LAAEPGGEGFLSGNDEKNNFRKVPAEKSFGRGSALAERRLTTKDRRVKDQLIVQGNRVPQGTVAVSGAKNSATRLLSAATLSPGPVTLFNFPTELVDAREKIRFLRDCGVRANVDDSGETVRVETGHYSAAGLTDFFYPFRTTYLLVAGQLLRNGTARIPYPGGCNLGGRGYDLHIMVWEKLGAQVEEKQDFIEVRCAGLKGAEIDFPITTVGGTENALLCGSVARRETVIRNAYITPEVEDLISFLRAMGASIELFGRSAIRITGRPEGLSGVEYSVMPDRIEAITWMIYAAISGGTVEIRNVPLQELEVPLIYLRHVGVNYRVEGNTVRISPDCISEYGIQPFETACGTHPGIHSDMQPFFTLLAMKAQGNSLVVDYRYPKRIAYLAELRKFCTDPSVLSWTEGAVKIKGPAVFKAAEADSTDLRGSMAVILAGLLADGRSVIHNPDMALRGYNRLVEKMRMLGLQCE
jgi:UDP-N-acetylglucosamine 1-carboxyvinyltransferase